MAKAMSFAETAREATVDPVTLEVVRAGLHSIISEMSITLNRTSYSTILREINDYSCVLFDSRGRLLAQAEGIPIFNGSMNFVDRRGDRQVPAGRRCEEGDIFLSNDPYTAGGTHKNDINVVMPIFWQGALVMLAANKAHHLDIGGKDPGSWSADARNTYQEGPLPACAPARPRRPDERGGRRDPDGQPAHADALPRRLLRPRSRRSRRRKMQHPRVAGEERRRTR